jgi:hypothetical protein
MDNIMMTNHVTASRHWYGPYSLRNRNQVVDFELADVCIEDLETNENNCCSHLLQRDNSQVAGFGYSDEYREDPTTFEHDCCPHSLLGDEHQVVEDLAVIEYNCYSSSWKNEIQVVDERH